MATMATAGLILSAVGTGLSFISLITGLVPDSSGSGGTSINIAAGDYDEPTISGTIDVRLYDRYANVVGSPQVDKYINRGNVAYNIDYSHYNEYRGVQAPYIKLTGNNDAICVAWTTITWPNGLDWTISGGAVASYCKAAPGYPSYAILGNDENGRRHRPDCFWIDGDGSIGGDRTAYSFYMPFFQTNDDGSYYGNICQGPALSVYYNNDDSGLSFFSPPPTIDNGVSHARKRDLSERQTLNNTFNDLGEAVEGIVDGVLVENPVIERLFYKSRNKLIVSELPEHSASQVCEADNTWGPSFVSTTEGTFCDMATKTLYGLCDGDYSLGDDDCFDLESTKLRGLSGLLDFGWGTVVRWTEDMGEVEGSTLTARGGIVR